MDQVDLNIIKELKKDAGKSFLKIAKEIGVSPKTVQNRFEKMKEKGTILRTTISIDTSKIGYIGKACLMITNASNEDEKLTIEALSRMQDVFMFADVIGDCDLLAIALIRDLKSFEKLLRDIKKVPSVDQVDFCLFTDTSFPIDEEYNKLPLE
jgi:DNA-binding Lrp family transcriptional regulator